MEQKKQPIREKQEKKKTFFNEQGMAYLPPQQTPSNEIGTRTKTRKNSK